MVLLLSEGHMSDHKGARLVLDALPPSDSLIADRGYDRAWFREEWTCRVFVPLQVLVYATFRSKATGLFQPNAEGRSRGL